MEVLDNWRKVMEQSASLKYRTIKYEMYTDDNAYLLSLPFMDKISTVHIFNDHDCRSIQYIE